MKRMYIDCSMGAAGDMLTGALLELMPDRDETLAMLNGMSVPGVSFSAKESVKQGIEGTHVTVLFEGAEEVTEDVSEEQAIELHPHEHEHPHSHCMLEDIERIIHSLKMPESVKEDVIGVYGIIAEAEGIAHDMPAGEVHFHEVGSMDAVADAAAVCLLMNEIAPDAVIVSDIHVGAGYVKCAHGVLPVPAPATANILAGLPTYGGEIQGELCTPTGAALLKHFGTEFGAAFSAEPGEDAGCGLCTLEHEGKTLLVRAGHGMGRKDFERPNCVTVMIEADG